MCENGERHMAEYLNSDRMERMRREASYQAGQIYKLEKKIELMDEADIVRMQEAAYDKWRGEVNYGNQD
jgi:hypothetical protein